MSPVRRFFEWLEVALNSVDVGLVFQVRRDESDVVFASTGEVLNIPKLVVSCLETPDMEVVVEGLSEVLEEFASPLWANDAHDEYLVGWARPLQFERQERFLKLATGEPKELLLWTKGAPCGYHNETRERKVLRTMDRLRQR